MILSRKIQLYIVGDKEEKDRVWKYLKEGVANQNKAANQYISAQYLNEILDATKEDKKELRKELKHLYQRVSTSKLGSAYDKDMFFPKGLHTTSAMAQRVTQDFDNAKKNGMMSGSQSLPSYKETNPLFVEAVYVKVLSKDSKGYGLYHKYSSDEEFQQHLYKPDIEIFLKFPENTTFKLNLGRNIKKSAFLRSEIGKVFSSEYKVVGSSIQLKDNEIFLNLGMEVPDKSYDLDKNVVVGVDVGVAIPAVCALNGDKYKRVFVGSADEFLAKRTQLQAQRRRLQIQLRNTNGGHGRKKKLKALDRLRDHEKNFADTFNHVASKRIVDFALNNRAKYINLEDLSSYSKTTKNNFILRNWSYYDLQEKITYKAKRCGIEVRKINPYMTSQTCSCCGNLEEGQRVDQSHFVCKKCGTELNADFNAARNIAMSEKFVR